MREIKRKTSYLIATLTVLISSSLFVDSSLAEKSAAEKFQEAMQYANSLRNTVRVEGNTVRVGTLEFKPQEVFKEQKGGYTENPPQTGHYQGVTQSNVYGMESAAISETAKDEDYKDANGNSVPTPGKTVTTGFSSRPVFKINQKADYIKNSKLITDNARNVVTGSSNKNINCEKKKTIACKTEYIEKTCNEEVRTIQKVCEKVPNITTYTKDVVYPNCQHTVVGQVFGGGCPSGYGAIYASDMVRHETYDDIYICQKTVNAGEGLECLGGYLVYGISGGSNHNVQSTVRGTVPKKMHGRLRFTNVYSGTMRVTIVNETTNTTLYNGSSFSNGQVVDLPFSETQDQVFRFEEPQRDRRQRFMFSGIGVMILSFDHMYREKAANVVWSEEKNCHEV